MTDDDRVSSRQTALLCWCALALLLQGQSCQPAQRPSRSPDACVFGVPDLDPNGESGEVNQVLTVERLRMELEADRGRKARQ